MSQRDKQLPRALRAERRQQELELGVKSWRCPTAAGQQVVKGRAHAGGSSDGGWALL